MRVVFPRFVSLAARSPLMPRNAHILRGAVRAALLAAAASVPAIVSLPASAALTVVGTRFIYSGGARAQTIAARNLGSTPILVQIWLDDGNANADPGGLRVPFVVAP
ncbi:fimbria/pilus periplasmic chaperone, partial [Ralstonia pickettii]|nr:fimbria/pilus periplasmic chaperone [Ralstonia pickettii]